MHRYVFLVYQQKSNSQFSGWKKITSANYNERKKFDVRQFASKYDLGKPIACNMFRAQNDKDALEGSDAQFVKMSYASLFAVMVVNLILTYY